MVSQLYSAGIVDTHGDPSSGLSFQHLHDQGSGSTLTHVLWPEVILRLGFRNLGFRSLGGVGLHADERMGYPDEL